MTVFCTITSGSRDSAAKWYKHLHKLQLSCFTVSLYGHDIMQTTDCYFRSFFVQNLVVFFYLIGPRIMSPEP